VNKYFLKTDVKRSFDQAAETYDEAAFLQREVADRLIERFNFISLQPRLILDLGAGTGYSTAKLEHDFKKAKIIAFDLAEKMLLKNKERKRWFDRKRYVCGDAERIPFKDNSFDLIFSNLMLHWINHLEVTITEIYRVLKPGGLLLFSTLGPDTLYELRQSWSTIDDSAHVHPFLDMHIVGDYLQQARFQDSVVDMEFISVTYNDLKKIFLDLKNLGTHNINKNRLRGLTGKSKFDRFIHAYEQYRNPEGFIPVTYEVVYGLGWKGENEYRQEGEISIPIGSLKKR
jgi:malonyl-CoA O-methyltransferase